MLSWALQKELARSILLDFQVRTKLKDVLQPSHFENPALACIIEVLLNNTDQVPYSDAEIEKALESKTDTIKEACSSLLKELEKSNPLFSERAIELGRKFAAYQETVILQGQLLTLARNEAWSEIRNRMEDLLELSSSVVEQENDGLIVQTMSDVTSEKIEWLWQDFIPLNKISTIEGDGGLGKSTIMLDVVARLTRGERQPSFDGFVSAYPVLSDAIIISAEDDVNDTIRPRLEAANADLSRVHFVAGVQEKYNGTLTERGVALDRDISKLENLIIKTGAKLVVVDPLVAMLGGADFHREQDVRRILKGLSTVAGRRKCAIVTIRHLNKDKGNALLSRGSGSIGIVSAVRTAMFVCKHPSSENDRVLAVYKTNIAKSPEQINPVIYRFQEIPGTQVARIEWVSRTNLTITQLFTGNTT